MRLHANAVAENRAAGVGAGGIDGNDSHAVVFFSEFLRQLINQRALARARRSGDAYSLGLTRVGKEFFEQINPLGSVILDDGDGASERPGVAGPQLLNQIFSRSQTESVKKIGIICLCSRTEP